MAEPGATLPWTDEQWAIVQRTAADAARRARVASTLLPLVGPLGEDQASIPELALHVDTEDTVREYYRTGNKRLSIDDGLTLKLTTLACEIYVRTQQAQDPQLSAVRQMVARAGVVIGRLEDAIVMRGQPGESEGPVILPGDADYDYSDPDYDDENPQPQPVVKPDIYRVQGGQQNSGLRDVIRSPELVDRGNPGENLVKAVVNVVQTLERQGQYGPFGAMLGHELYEAAHTPSEGSLVLPADRFVPFLSGGPLLRSTVLPPDEGVIVATGDAPVDLVIATDIHVSFVQRTPEPRYVLRVSERMVLRIKQPEAVAGLKAFGVAPAPSPTDPSDQNGPAKTGL